jgi:serine/threonine protein kinase
MRFDTTAGNRNHSTMPDGLLGTTAGNYRFLDKLSDGGMGAVYRAEHTMLGRLVAIKVLHPEFTHNREIVNRFFNEAKATTAIHHPGIVEVFDFGYLESGFAYLVMELLHGMTLAKRIKLRGPMPEGEAAAMLRGVCSGLAAAHDKGIIHRDLKPDNLFLIEDQDAASGERLKILDFGIAKLTDLGSAHAATKTGAVMGTPTYMSPEQCRGSGTVGARADIYSLGCIFYQLLTGRPPFAMEGAGEVIGMHLYVQPEPPSRVQLGISGDTDALVMAMLSKDPSSRPQTARDLAQHLAGISHAHGWATTSDARWSLDGTNQPGRSFTPAFNPTPAAPRTSPPALVARPDQPTTLSGAASQSIAVPPSSKRGLLIGLAALVVVGGGLGAVAALGGHSGGLAGTNHATKAEPPVVTPTPAPTVVAPTPPPTPAPAADPPVITPPPAPPTTPPKPPAVLATQPAEKQVLAKKPVDKKPADKKPAEKRPAKPDNGDLPIEHTVE